MSYEDAPLYFSNVQREERKSCLRWTHEVLKEKEEQKSDPSHILQEWIGNHPHFDPDKERYKWKKLK